MKIGIAADHGAYELKESIKKELSTKYEIVDVGNLEYDKLDDYPVYAFRLGEKVAKGEFNFGIALCTSGIGISIACNKVKNVRCAYVHNIEDVIATRLDNDSNIITFSGITSLDDAIKYITTFVETKYSNIERHNRRNKMILDYENGMYNEL